MRASDDSRQPEDASCRHACPKNAATSPLRRDVGEAWQKKAKRGIARNKRAILLAGRADDKGRGVLCRTAKLNSFARARTAPIILEDDVRYQAGAQKKAQKQEEPCLCGEVQEWRSMDHCYDAADEQGQAKKAGAAICYIFQSEDGPREIPGESLWPAEQAGYVSINARKNDKRNQYGNEADYQSQTHGFFSNQGPCSHGRSGTC